MTEIDEHKSIDVFIGIDVGKNAHHAVALDRSSRRLFDRCLPNDGAKLRALTDGLREHGKALLVVDQPASIGALIVPAYRHREPNLRIRRPRGRLRSVGARHTPLRLFGARRATFETRQQAAQTRDVPVGVRVAPRSRLRT